MRRDLDKQTRVFAYQDGRMVQSGGPRSFAAGTTDVRAVDLNNTTLFIATNDMSGSPHSYLGYVKTSGGTGTAYFEKIVGGSHVGKVAVTVAVRQTLVVRTGDRETAVAMIDLMPADDRQHTVVMAYHRDESTGYAARDPWTVAMPSPGEDFVTLVASDNRLDVELSIIEGDGHRAFVFNPDPTGARWVAI